ncbi:hypothetical protein ES703_19526 [subsurface metagenome]
MPLSYEEFKQRIQQRVANREPCMFHRFGRYGSYCGYIGGRYACQPSGKGLGCKDPEEWPNCPLIKRTLFNKKTKKKEAQKHE